MVKTYSSFHLHKQICSLADTSGAKFLERKFCETRNQPPGRRWERKSRCELAFRVQNWLPRRVSFCVRGRESRRRRRSQRTSRGGHRKAGGRERPRVLIKSSSAPPAPRRSIRRGAAEWRNQNPGQREPPFKRSANRNPNDLKPFQQGIKATCYFE